MPSVSVTQFNFRGSGAHFRTRPGTGPYFQAGDTVSWRNPANASHWGGLVVEFVHPTLGVAVVRGWFGRLSFRTGGQHVETRRVRLDQLTLVARAGEQA